MKKPPFTFLHGTLEEKPSVNPQAAPSSEEPQGVSMRGEFRGCPRLLRCPIPGPTTPKHSTPTRGDSQVAPRPCGQVTRGARLGARTSTRGRTSQGRAFGREILPSEAGGEEDAEYKFCCTGHCSGPASARRRESKLQSSSRKKNRPQSPHPSIYGANRPPAH